MSRWGGLSNKNIVNLVNARVKSFVKVVSMFTVNITDMLKEQVISEFFKMDMLDWKGGGEKE